MPASPTKKEEKRGPAKAAAWVKLRNESMCGDPHHSVGDTCYQVSPTGEIVVPLAQAAWLESAGWIRVGEVERPPEGSFWPVSETSVPRDMDEAYQTVRGLGLSPDELRKLADRMENHPAAPPPEKPKDTMELSLDSPLEDLIKAAKSLGLDPPEKADQRTVFNMIVQKTKVG